MQEQIQEIRQLLDTIINNSKDFYKSFEEYDIDINEKIDEYFLELI